MNYEIGNPQWAWLLLLVPAVLMLQAYGAWANRRARKLFGVTESSRARIVGGLSAVLLAVGVGLLAVACMDMRWGKTTREVPQRGLEVVFALDVSRSMLAQDAKPNRLTRAKQQIKDMLSEMAGDRVGLVVFAGEANQAVPLTNHYHDFQQKLDSVGPESVPVGGSQLGVAIKVAAEAFLSKTNDHKTVVLFTDGEDQESQPIELAKKLHAEDGLRIFTVGLGDVAQGARIPQDSEPQRSQRRPSQRGQFVQHNGQQIWSKLNGSILKQIATESNAAYIPAGTKRVNMADVYHRFIANVEQAEFETAKISAFIPRFQWFAFPALVCVVLASLLGSGPRKQAAARNVGTTQAVKRNVGASGIGKATAILLLWPSLALAQSRDAESVPGQINAANELLRQKKTIEAIDAYNAIDSAGSETQDELQYNLATAHYRNSDIAAAETLYLQTASSDNQRIARDSHYNLGNCRYAKALPLADQQPELAITELEQATEHYRRALRLDRGFANARENLERARKLIKQLRQKQEQKSNKDDQSKDDQSKDDQSKDDQSKDDQSKDDQSKDDQSKQEQENEKSDQSESSDNGADQDSSQNDDSKKSENAQQQQPSDDQQRQEGKSDSSQENSQQSNSAESENTSDEQSGGQSDQQAREQSKASQQQQPSDPQSQSANDQQEPNMLKRQDEKDGEEPPEGDLSAVNDMQANDEPSEDKPNGSMARQNDQNSGTMTRQEALKLLQAVRDRDMLRRLRQQQRQRRNRVPVEKDW